MSDTVSAFNPFETHLDQTRALQHLRAAVSGADDGELFFERRRSEVLSFDDGRLRNASFDASEGFGLRAVHGVTTGYAHASEISDAAVARAVDTVRLAAQGSAAQPAPAPLRGTRDLYTHPDPVSTLPFATKRDLLAEMDAFARALDPRVVQVSATISASQQDIAILRPEGEVIQDTRPMAQLVVSIIVAENGRRESGFAAGGGRIDITDLAAPEIWQAKLREALRIALVNLTAEDAPAGVMDVVLGPGWPGILLHEAIGHGLEGDFHRKESSVFSGMMGKQIASKGVTVVDDGTIANRRGSLNFDDEGTESQRNVLIEDGNLVGLMQDRQNARLMGTKPTGNGRRESYAHAPMPRMTNTYMLGGDTAPEDLVADLKDGIYAIGFGGGQVDITSGKFVFSCTEAYRVKNGKIGAPVKGATLIGDGATALNGIHGIGNDMSLDPGLGSCGKNGQSVPVGVGQPSLMISGLTVGGAGT